MNSSENKVDGIIIDSSLSLTYSDKKSSNK